ncbi:MAG: tetratricopeptide repeat protein [Pyrinomonadaceae bacterium]
MNRKIFWLSLVAVVISFAGGFLLANALNRREIENLTAEAGRLKTAPPVEAEKDSPEAVLTDEEIRQKIAEADKNSGDIESQKNLALALYRYSTMTRQTKWLPDIARLLGRAAEKNPKDYNSLNTLGDIYFDLAQNAADSNSAEAKNDINKNLELSRGFYQKVLAMNPNDALSQTNLGATFLFANPPENEKAMAEFQKSLQTSPKNEKTLEFITRAFINTGKTGEAEKYFDKLREINPKNEALPELETQLSQPDKK